MMNYKKADIDFQYEIRRTPAGADSAVRYRKAGDVWEKIDSDNSGTATILCGGDLMCEPAMSEACYCDGEYHFKACFKYLRPALKQSDLAIANLETLVSPRFPYAREKHIVQHHTGSRYHCNAPVEYLDALRYAGFDGFVLANNHNADGGYEGILDTLQNVDDRAFMRTGMFRDAADNRCLLVDINGIRLGILSYTEHINRELDREVLTEEGCRVLLNRYSREKLKKDIENAKKRGAEFILVYIHLLGKEYSHEIIDRQRKTAQEIADAGADCIMGSHTHSIQEYDQIVSADGRTVPVIYSLGNLISSDRTSLIARRSVIYRLKLRKTGGKVIIAGESYIPVRVVEGIRSSDFVAQPTQPEYWNGVRSEFLENAQHKIEEEIGRKLSLVDYREKEEIDPGKADFETVRKLTVGKICRVIGLDPATVPTALRNEPIEYVTARYTWVRRGCAYFSRYLGDVEEPEARQAYQRGAKVIFSSKPIKDEKGNSLPCIIVPDPAQRFYAFNRWLKSLYPIPTLAITGSVGKTTTKEMVYSVLSTTYNTLKNVGNANTYAAIGDTIFKLTPRHEVYVQEVCAFSPGWVEGGSKMLAPNMCLITNIGYPHVDLYGSIENIFYDKTSLVRNLPDDGVAFLNYDDERLAKLETDKKIISFAIDHDADYKADDIVYDDGCITFSVVCDEGRFPVRIHMHGAHNILNALAAFAVGRHLNIPVERIVKALDEYRSEGMRQNVLNVGGYHLYLDCYNSAPNSVLTSVHALSLIPPEVGGKRVAVLGDIPRLGNQSRPIHKEVAEKLLAEDIDLYLLFGPYCEEMHKVMAQAGRKSLYTQDRAELNDFIRTNVNRGDVVLFKAGHPTALAKTVDQVFGTSFHLTDGDVLLDSSHDASDATFRARWIDEAIEIRGSKKVEADLRIPTTTDGKTPVRRIGQGAYKGQQIKRLSTPEALQNIGIEAFADCKQLEQAALSRGLMVLEDKAFSGCAALRELTLPDTLIDIGEKAFAGCAALCELRIPASVGHIGEDAFEGCGNLTLLVEPGSCAERFAEETHLAFKNS